MAYSTPFILESLASIDFLNNNTQKIDGKTPFYDDGQWNMKMPKKGETTISPKQKRPSIHLKDSWVVRYSVSNGVATVKLRNTKRSADGKWVIADLLWEGTRDYNIDAPTIRIDVPVMYKSVADIQGPRTGGWSGLARAFRKMNRLQGKDTVRQTIFKGHHTGKMSFYNRYTGTWNFNRTFRHGIRDELVRSFRQFILLCVEDGIKKGIDTMQSEGILRSKITSVSVRIA